jgi:DNA repair exonuclease SbcCD ATPase subunit
MIPLAVLLCNYGRGFCLIDIGTEGNLRSLEQTLETEAGALVDLDTELREAERALLTVTSSVGTVREQVAQTAANLTAAEREIDRVIESAQEITELQESVNKWISDARVVVQQSPGGTNDLTERREAFVNALRRYLTALGHSAIKPEYASTLQLDEQYTPYLNNRRLRSLGSASDQSRLVAAYSLALAAASEQVGGFHPGIVILDEPLQQNPDEIHRELFLAFLSKELARAATFQTIIFTWLNTDEIRRLREQGTNVITPDGDHFLQLLPSEESTYLAS